MAGYREYCSVEVSRRRTENEGFGISKIFWKVEFTFGPLRAIFYRQDEINGEH